MGQGRDGLYTYEWIENALGAQIHNLDRIDPDLQRLNIAARSAHHAPGTAHGRPQQLELHATPGGHVASGRTRLIVRGRTSEPSGPASWLARQVELLLLEPGYS